MEQSLKNLYRKVRAEFSGKAYLLLTAVLFAVTLVQSDFPVKFSATPYQYQYGNWITIYQQADYGQQNIWFHLFHGSLGVQFSPLALFWDSFLLYLVYILLVLATEGIRRKMFPPRIRVK